MITIDGQVRDSVMAHRYRFLEEVQKLVPEVLADLERDVLRPFRGLFRDEPRQELGECQPALYNQSGLRTGKLWVTWPSLREALEKGHHWIMPSWSEDIRGAQLNSGALKFRDAIEKWAETHNLRSEEILGDAFSTLFFWLVRPHGPRIWQFPPTLFRMDESNAPRLHIEETWRLEPWTITEQRIKEQIANYEAEVKTYSATVDFDLDRMRDSRTHHQWLALYQCTSVRL